MVVPVVRITVALRNGAAASRGDGAAGGLIKKVPKGYLVRNMVFVVMVVESIDDTTITDVGSVVSAEKIGDNSKHGLSEGCLCDDGSRKEEGSLGYC